MASNSGNATSILARINHHNLWCMVMLKTYIGTYILLMSLAICLFMIIAAVGK